MNTNQKGSLVWGFLVQKFHEIRLTIMFAYFYSLGLILFPWKGSESNLWLLGQYLQPWLVLQFLSLMLAIYAGIFLPVSSLLCLASLCNLTSYTPLRAMRLRKEPRFNVARINTFQILGSKEATCLQFDQLLAPDL